MDRTDAGGVRARREAFMELARDVADVPGQTRCGARRDATRELMTTVMLLLMMMLLCALTDGCVYDAQ
jgi:hypothetical protein